MKRTVTFIFIFTVILFTACADKASTPKPSYDETILTETTEGHKENTTEDTTEIEISDEEYLINLGKRLKLGMTAQEVIEEIGEPDMDLGSGVTYLIYCQGDYNLCVRVSGKVSEVSVYNDKTDETTYIYPIHDGETETAE